MRQIAQFAEEANGSPESLYRYLASFTLDPLSYTRAVFPWGQGELADSRGPYDWQEEILSIIRDHLCNKKTRYKPLRIAVASGHGIGKSALVAFITKWALGTCADAKVVITANTGKQLETKTSPELAKWHRLALDTDLWEVKATSITSRMAGSEKTWRADLIPWSENNSEAFAGLHNKGRVIVLIFDEASGIARVIWDTAQGALTDERTIIIWLAFGNPTLNEGCFSECFGSDKARWIRRQIDSRTVPGTNKQELNEWVEKYGEDSDYVRVRVRGEFPRAGSNQFIPSDVVAACRVYKAKGYESLPTVLICDVARFGDDETVISMRQGRKFQILDTYRGIDTEMTAQHVIECKGRHNPDAIVVDGDGIGGAVVDHLRARGYREQVFEFHGGAEPADKQMYYNKRAECWGKMRDWLTDGAEIPDEPELGRELTGPMYFIARGKIHHGSICIEAKEDMKKRGLASPNRADTLAMSFGVTIAAKSKQGQEERPLPTLRTETAWMY